MNRYTKRLEDGQAVMDCQGCPESWMNKAGAARYREGYRIKELEEFLGINRENVRKNLARLGVVPYAHDELDPLSSRKAEFNQLGD